MDINKRRFSRAFESVNWNEKQTHTCRGGSRYILLRATRKHYFFKWKTRNKKKEGACIGVEFCIVISTMENTVLGFLFPAQMSICIPSDLNSRLSWLASLYLNCVLFLWAKLQCHRCAKRERAERIYGMEKSELKFISRALWVLFISLNSHLCCCMSNRQTNLATILHPVKEIFRNVCVTK